MKFVATEDIAAPAEAVWAQASDFEGFEARARTRMGDLVRTPPGPAGRGTTWRGEAEVMGKRRRVAITLGEVDAPRRLAASAEAEGVEVDFVVDLQVLGPDLTRMTVTTEARARSLAARLVLQSAKLAQGQMVRRYESRVADFADRVERTA